MGNADKPSLTSYIDKSTRKRHWVVQFRFTDPGTKERKRFQFRGTINRFKTDSEKIIRGNTDADNLNKLLEQGWNPFHETPGQFIRRQTGGFVNRPRTISECLEECYNIKMKQLTSQDAPRSYRYIYHHFRKWLETQFLDKLKPDNFGTVHAMAYADQLTREGKKGRGFNNYRTILKVFFNMMLTREVIYKNPFKEVPVATTTEAEIVPFQDAELKAIWNYMKENGHYNLYVFTKFSYYTLLRPIELIKLQVKHIDLARGKINLPAAASKNRKSRSCDMPPALRILINEWLEVQGVIAYKQVNDYLFGHGLKICPQQLVKRNSVTRCHAKILKELKFEGRLSLYSYKYSGIINSYLAGISLEEIRRQCGHHSIEITQIYMSKLNLLKPSSFGTVNY